MISVIDSDSIVYRAGFASQKSTYEVFLPGQKESATKSCYESIADARKDCLEIKRGAYIKETIIPEPLENCLHSVKKMLEGVFEATGADEYKLFLSGSISWRKAIYPAYKKNRLGVPKPFYFDQIREYLKKHWGAKVVVSLEADDICGITHYQRFIREPNATVLVSIDKDLDMLPGLHYNYVTKELYEITDSQAYLKFYKQVLTGDTSDNIKGIKGVGDSTAHAMLAECHDKEDYWQLVQREYSLRDDGREATGWKHRLDVNARLLWIWRKQNDHYEDWIK